jgi:serine/threonine protein kinase
MEAELDQYAGQYEIVSLLGEGGQASVYLGRRNENRFALKVYRTGASREAAYRKEVEVLSAIEHENHIKMLDRAPAARFKLSNANEEHRPLIVLELAEGG